MKNDYFFTARKKESKKPQIKINKATSLIQKSIKIFQKAIEDVDKANELLNSSIELENEEIENLKTKLSEAELLKKTATSQIEANLILRENLKKFQV